MTEYHEIYKIHLEHLVIPENKEMLKKKKKNGGCQKDTKANGKSSQWPKLDKNEATNLKKGNFIITQFIKEISIYF